MSFFKSRRRRRILIAIGGTALGIAVLTGLAFWLEIHRETDLADPAAKVTSRFKDFEMADSA
ncbi:MAG TPA: hypothetical protein EYG38_15330, partial [Verrucomicrobia bacterium]|nr:hypothetical protein [Verrucomicrobiota bacterium]